MMMNDNFDFSFITRMMLIGMRNNEEKVLLVHEVIK
jgi:hypothetical protein